MSGTSEEASGAALWTDDQPHVSYYEVLGVARDASTDEIRRAYRRKALRCHPDKRGNDPAAAEEFQRISKANEVLSDDKKRKVYDKYGPNGVEMMDKIPFLDVSMILALKNMFCLITVAVAVLLLFPIFLSLKIDDRISWSWPAVFSPSFVILGIVVLAAFASPISTKPDPESGEPAEPLSAQLFDKASNTIYFTLLLIFDVLVSVKLEGSISVNWGSVFAIWYVIECMNVFSTVTAVLAEIKSGVLVDTPENIEEAEDESAPKRPMTSTEICLLVFSQFNFPILRIIQAILLAFKLDNQDMISWPATFAPLYILIALNLVAMFAAFVIQTIPTLKSPQERRGSIVMFSFAFAIVAAIASGFTYLLVRRINGGDGWPPAAVVLIPVFFVFALALCCCGCLLPCFLSVFLKAQMAEMNEMSGRTGPAAENAAAASESPAVPASRQIEAPVASA